MTIKIFTDRIDIGDFTLFEGNGGVQFAGVARAENFLGNQGFQGSVAGFFSGGYSPSPAVNTIDKFPFATDTNASDQGDLSVARRSSTGSSSQTHGFTAGGVDGPTFSNTVDKFLFSASSNATDHGDLLAAGAFGAGQTSSTHGYVTSNFPPSLNTIQKFPFSTNSNATDVGDATNTGYQKAGNSSKTHGYSAGGYGGGNTIDKFPFATDSNASDVGDLTETRWRSGGASSSEYGYVFGGQLNNPQFDVIDKFPFSTNSNSTDVGDLDFKVTSLASVGVSSTTHGYKGGGYQSSAPVGNAPTPATSNRIEKFSFATDGDSVETGQLVAAKRDACGSQD